MVVLAALTALGGLVALLAGAYGLRQTRRIRAAGRVTEALVKPPQPGSERPLLQFETADGRVVEVVSPVPRSRRRPLTEGGHIRLFYDVDDPRETVLLGSERAASDRAFVVVGAALIVLEIALAVFGPR
ncbi:MULTISPECIES: DUF3592 domain-containing protein [Streptomyces]|uniref:DUF3592 domain-containing protein n=1 Tax=Streptomyces dengpaensis TaxID=2049881 RepID=A0ABM6SXJ5_9ACTN|nr:MULTISPECIES: DUF3592 domain-containing protein [Streptomyces]AVH59332.1 hypothetical protein C4B68_30315 [Streptomyces dengpaensis]PIB05301.1 hypothetical protein B1C81_29805 [Streptomyces sp. HG99]